MALTSKSTINEALDQFNENLVWEGNGTKANLALEAVRFLLINRAQSYSIQGRSISRESLLEAEEKLSKFVNDFVNSNRQRFVIARPKR